jgi:hypothetical protein
VENFRFFDLNIYALADVQGAVAEVKGEGLIVMAAVPPDGGLPASCGRQDRVPEGIF